MEEIKLQDNINDKKQPSNLEAEQALIGSILVNNDIIDEVSTIINPTSFYDPAHHSEFIVDMIAIPCSVTRSCPLQSPVVLVYVFER